MTGRLVLKCLCLLLLAAAVAGPRLAAQEFEDPEAARKAREALLERLNRLDEWFSEAEAQRARWEKDVKAKDIAVSRVARQVEEAGAALASANKALDELGAEQKALEQKRAAQAKRIGEHLAASYRIAGQDFIKMLLNQQSPDRLNRLVRYHQYFTEARLAEISDYQKTLDTMADNRFRLETQRDDAAQKQELLSREQLVLTREREERKALIVGLNAEAESKEAERKRLLADQQRLDDLIAELERRATKLDGSAFVARRGSLPWPLPGPLKNAFGQPRADGRLSWHGVVIGAKEGTPVKAVFRGRVVFANWLRGFGLLTIIDHGGGYMSLYGYADILLKADGEWVESGEVIAHAGRSGGQTSSGLYFEVRHDGVARDPIGWLAKR